VGPQLRASVHAAVLKLPGVEDAYVNLVFIPPWNAKTMATDDVLLSLGLG
jgi:metal-sulfur cluster biosynthetic enzyme